MRKHKTHFYVDVAGNLLGGFGDGATPPDGAVKVDKTPKHGLDVWDFGKKKWIDYVPIPQPAPDMDAAIRALINGDAVGALAAMDKME